MFFLPLQRFPLLMTESIVLWVWKMFNIQKDWHNGYKCQNICWTDTYIPKLPQLFLSLLFVHTLSSESKNCRLCVS